MPSSLRTPSFLRRVLAARGRNGLIVGLLITAGIASAAAAGFAAWQRAQAYQAHDAAAHLVEERKQQLQQRQRDSVQAAATQAWLRRIRAAGLGTADWIDVPQVMSASNVSSQALSANLQQLETGPARVVDVRAISLESADRVQSVFDANNTHFAVKIDGKVWMRRSASNAGKQR